jgi:hypothetical protein
MKISKLLLSLGTIALLMTACSEEKKEEQPDLSCRISGSVAPMWVCMGDDLNPDTISAVGIGSISGGEAFQRKVALANGRSDLINRIKVEFNSRNIEIPKSITLNESRVVNEWTEPKSKNLYVLVSVPTPKVLQ